MEAGWRAAPTLEHFNIFYLSFKHKTFLMLFIFVRLSPSHSSGAPPPALLLPLTLFREVIINDNNNEAKRGELFEPLLFVPVPSIFTIGEQWLPLLGWCDFLLSNRFGHALYIYSVKSPCSGYRRAVHKRTFYCLIYIHRPYLQDGQ